MFFSANTLEKEDDPRNLSQQGSHTASRNQNKGNEDCREADRTLNRIHVCIVKINPRKSMMMLLLVHCLFPWNGEMANEVINREI